MNYDVVVNVGCSFMNGDQILTPEEQSITKLQGMYRSALQQEILPGQFLSKFLGDIPCVNIADTGYSNDTIMSKIYEWVESNEIYTKPFFMIGLTGTSRMRIWNETQNRYYDLHPFNINDYKGRYLDILNNKITNGLDKTENLKFWCKYYIKWIYSIEVEDKKLQRNVILLHHYLKGNNCDYRIHNSLQDSLGDIKNKINHISFINKDYIEEDAWNLYLRWQMKTVDKEDFNNDELYRRNTPPYGKRFCKGHPSPNANKELAIRVYESLK